MQMDGWMEMTFKSSREYPLCLINLNRILSSSSSSRLHISPFTLQCSQMKCQRFFFVSNWSNLNGDESCKKITDDIHLWINVSSLFFAYIKSKISQKDETNELVRNVMFVPSIKKNPIKNYSHKYILLLIFIGQFFICFFTGR